MNVENNLPSGWVETTLGEIAIINPRESITKGAIAKSIPMASLDPFTKKIQSFGIKEFKGGTKFRNGDTLLARITPCLENGKTAYVDILKENEVGFGSTEYIVIREREHYSDKHFLFYLSISPLFRDVAIKVMTGTSGRQRVQTDVLLNRKFNLPTLPEQQAIASILTTFDDKIELLQAQNQTLEATAQTIFKEWFGKYQVGDVLPEGWRVVELESFFDFLEGPGIRNWQYTDEGNRFINIRLIQNNDINVESANCVSIEEANGKYSHFQLKEKDFVLSTSGTLGRGAIVRKEHLPLLLNTSVIRFRPRDGYSYGYTYQFLQSRYFLHELESLASGSVQLNFGPMHLRQIVMVLPDEKALQEYAEKVNTLYNKMIQNLSQIQSLQQTRDTLLPKLMSGKVRVDEFKE